MSSYIFVLEGLLMDAISKELSDLESHLGLPSGFYNVLLAEDDWSFVIKLSALFEAASGQALGAKLQHPEIEIELAYLEQSQKINLITKLDIITKEQSTFLIKLSELRNKLVHNISEVTFDFGAYTSNFDKQAKRSFAKVYGHGIHENFTVNGVSFNRTDFTVKNSKMAMWITAQEILACLHADITHSANISKVNKIGQELVKKYCEALKRN